MFFTLVLVQVLYAFLETGGPLKVNHLLRLVLVEIMVYSEMEVELLWK